jgi:hypothetical protein
MRPRPRRHHALDVPSHPRFAGFEAFAAREIFPWLADKEAGRRRALRLAATIAGATVAVAALLLYLGFAVFGTDPVVAVIVFGGVPAFLGFAAAYIVLHLFRASLKAFLLPKVCERLKLRYLGDAPDLPFDAFLAAGLLPSHSGRHFEDGIESEEAGIVFDAAEARLTVRRRSSKGGSTTKTVWRGLLLAARSPRGFKGTTLVLPARGFVERLFDGRKAERVELGLGELEAGLEIRSTAPQEAKGVLTESVMRKLADLAHRLGPERPSLALIGGHVLLAIRSKHDRFEGGSLFEPLDDPARVEDLLWEISNLCDLAEALGRALRLERARPAAAPGQAPGRGT